MSFIQEYAIATSLCLPFNDHISVSPLMTSLSCSIGSFVSSLALCCRDDCNFRWAFVFNLVLTLLCLLLLYIPCGISGFPYKSNNFEWFLIGIVLILQAKLVSNSWTWWKFLYLNMPCFFIFLTLLWYLSLGSCCFLHEDLVHNLFNWYLNVSFGW